MSSQDTTIADDTAFAQLQSSSVALLTTFRRSGTSVGTPVGINLVHGKAYFTTWSTTGKIKRIVDNPHVTLAPCTRGGTATGPAAPGVARRLEGSEAERTHAMLGGGFRRWLWEMVYKLFLRAQPVIYEVILDGSTAENQQ
jgi:uncharacterized protein